MRRRLLGILIVAGTLLIPSFGYSLISIADRGEWPSAWPKELDQYRKQAKTIGVAHGIQETVYEIRFNSRDEFEKAWPHILKLKSPGAPLILERSPSTYNRSGTKAEAGVRILCPSGGTARMPDGTELKADAPWPESARLSGGGLPEYVVAQDGKWVPFDGKERRGFLHRARVDIMLITDGQIVDMNSTPLPENTPVIDRRFSKADASPNVQAQIDLLLAQLGADDWKARQAAEDKLVQMGDDVLSDLQHLRQWTANEEVRTRVEAAIRQIKNRTPVNESWGKAVEGIQVRLTPDKRLWKEGEDPSFKVEMHNKGARQLQTGGICSLVLEVDGKVFGPKAWSRLGEIESRPFGPGTEATFAVSLGEFGPALPPGRHTIKAALLDNVQGNSINTSLTGYPETALAFSNLVDIEIMAKSKENKSK